MDWIERFFRQNKEGFDQIEVEETMWQNIRQAMDEPPTPTVQRPIRHFWWAAAAAIVLALGIGFWAADHAQPMGNEQASKFDLQDTFPDIALRNPQGEVIPISSLKGKVVLVEFWASYSMVCTEDHCYVFKPIYDEFKDKGFEIYGVSVDSSAASWVEAIQRDELDWVNVSDLNGATSPLAQHFRVEDLPMTFLLDGEGRIIAKNLDANQLKDTLHQILAMNN